MSAPDAERDDAQLAAALREGLAARDRSARTPHFSALWPTARADSRDRATSTLAGLRSATAWRPALAALAAVVVVAGLSWTWIDRSTAPDSAAQQAGVANADAALAHELSSPDYWRVPTDELLAYAAPPLNADLPSPSGFELSLEESLL